jgi:Leucine-rich repeat (LRR) protein
MQNSVLFNSFVYPPSEMRSRRCLLTSVPGDANCEPTQTTIFNRETEVEIGQIHSKEIKLRHSDIKTILISERNEQLEFLDLSHNQLEFLPDELCEALPNIKHLKLQGNRLTSLPKLEGMDKLQELWIGDCLGGNNIANLPKLPGSLKKLFARGNRLRQLDPLPRLEELDVSCNDLVSLPRMENVKVVRAAGNRIMRIGDGWLSASPHLVLLDVSHNHLQHRLFTRPGLTILQEQGNQASRESDLQFTSLFELCRDFCSILHLGLPEHLEC